MRDNLRQMAPEEVAVLVLAKFWESSDDAEERRQDVSVPVERIKELVQDSRRSDSLQALQIVD